MVVACCIAFVCCAQSINLYVRHLLRDAEFNLFGIKDGWEVTPDNVLICNDPKRNGFEGFSDALPSVHGRLVRYAEQNTLFLEEYSWNSFVVFVYGIAVNIVITLWSLNFSRTQQIITLQFNGTSSECMPSIVWFQTGKKQMFRVTKT